MIIAATDPAVAPPPPSLDDLAQRTSDELHAIYLAAGVPASLAALDGPLVGRMLAVRGLGSGLLARALRRFAARPGFPWAGKSFEASGAHGEGINRLRLPGLLGRQALFPFATRLGASALDGGRAVILDYSSEDNPPWIRRVHDEVREVTPGLFLGPAMWKKAGGEHALVLWFALDARLR